MPEVKLIIYSSMHILCERNKMINPKKLQGICFREFSWLDSLKSPNVVKQVHVII